MAAATLARGEAEAALAPDRDRDRLAQTPTIPLRNRRLATEETAWVSPTRYLGKDCADLTL